MSFAGLAVARSHWAQVAPLALVLVVAGQAAPSSAETNLERTTRTDDLLRIPEDNLEMAAAMRKAQATLGDFIALVRRPPWSASGFSVKIPLPVAGGGFEYIWMYPIEIRPDGRVSGVLNNRVVEAEGYQEGQTVTVHQSDIVDWGYKRRSRLFGHFTTCVLMDREPDGEHFKTKYGFACER